MTDIIDGLYAGGDSAYEKIKDKSGWKTLRACKYGPGGHQETLGYRSLAAPQGPDYLATTKGDHMALNFIDANDPNFIPREMVTKGLEYIDKELSKGNKVLVACNAGHSRGPTTAMLYLRSVGELTGNFTSSERIFRTLYPDYDPGIGVRTFARGNWDYFKDLLRKDTNG